MKLHLSLLVLLILFFNSSCNNDPIDPCEGITCLNGGVCDDGTCHCPDGYYGTNCETKIDPCDDIRCLNGGTCNDGDCDCPEGYDGEYCQYQLTPYKIRISKIIINKFPVLDSDGGSWDLGSGADLYISLLDDQNNTVWTSPTYFEDATDENYLFEPNPYIDLDEPENLFKIQLLDYDTFDAD